MRCRGVRLVAIFVATAGCWSAPTAAIEQPAPQPIAAPRVDSDGRSFAIVLVTEPTEECGGGFVLKTLDRNPEMRVMVHELVKRFPDMQVAPGKGPVRSASTLVRGIQSLPVAFTPA